MSRPRIAVVGASVRGAAFSLLRAGCDVAAADLFADTDLQRVCPATRITNYHEGLADWLADTPCDGWLYTGALENHPELVDRMAQLRPLLGNQGDALWQVRDVMRLQEVLQDAGLHFPETKPCDGTPPTEGEWLHKTAQGGNGSGVSRVTGERPAGGYWQREITGSPSSAQFLARGDGTCTLNGITRQLVGEAWTGAGEFQYCGTLAPWELPLRATADLAQLGQVLSTQYSLCGLFGVDFIFDGQRPWIVEVNPRVTAAMEVVERVTGRNLLVEHLGEFGISVEQHETPKFRTAGKIVLYAKQPLAVSQCLSEQLLADAGDCDHPPLADIPSAGTHISPGEPVVTMLAEGHSLAEVEAGLRERVASLERTLYRDSGGS